MGFGLGGIGGIGGCGGGGFGGFDGVPSILFRLSPGVRVDVVFDHTGPRGLQATFLGFERNSALFLVDNEVLFINPRSIQAISIHHHSRDCGCSAPMMGQGRVTGRSQRTAGKG
ncbi:hypothetical protein [Paenibacillus sp. OV219]|uniref:hypothetical protein n=1 Tax=Paenibacillus sp. OV219 TaxID=1884377 RepID=UPI0008C8A055|nr:hypothetical protein [Paenibacillus sp. OV219]SEP17321.1 hypothetical protein SAMN05518847_1253 [Paenibacillus sp. OV219]